MNELWIPQTILFGKNCYIQVLTVTVCFYSFYCIFFVTYSVKAIVLRPHCKLFL